VTKSQPDGDRKTKPAKLPCVVLAEPRRAPENRGPKFTLRTAGGGESNLKVKSQHRGGKAGGQCSTHRSLWEQTKRAHRSPCVRRCFAPHVALTRPPLLRFALLFFCSTSPDSAAIWAQAFLLGFGVCNAKHEQWPFSPRYRALVDGGKYRGRLREVASISDQP
jgi:hypothetical protein